MSALARLQHDFQDYVLGRGQGVLSHVQAASKGEAAARIDVYARAYELRLLEVLSTAFPALHVLAGDDAFEALGRQYIRTHPSESPNARWFGDRFAHFIAASEAFPSSGVMAEMARFEWAMGLAFDASDRLPLSLEELAAIPPGRFGDVTFALHPSVQRLSLAWNVPAFWNTVESKIDPPSLAAAQPPVEWVIWRPELATYFRSVEPDEACALDAVAGGESFGSVCELLVAVMRPAEVPPRAAQLVRRWTEDGLLAGINRGLQA